MSDRYSEAGVSLEAGYDSVKRIKKHVDRTKVRGSIDSLGAFGGMFDLSLLNLKEPLLVSGTDGVGTKLLLAIDMDRHDTIGEDVVAMCVNDVLVQGATPLFFLDYIAVGKNSPSQIEEIVKGVANGCVKAKCALIGGETAEMPGMYDVGHYDIAGFTVGVVEKSKLITGANIQEGDIVLGIKSSGLHSNGFSLVRKILKDRELTLDSKMENSEVTLGETLLTPTKIYVECITKLLSKVKVNGMVHITGGGFYENIPRVLPNNLMANLDLSQYEIPPIFKLLQREGNMELDEMGNVFNMGIGFIVIIRSEDYKECVDIIKESGEEVVLLGEITSRVEERGVSIKW